MSSKPSQDLSKERTEYDVATQDLGFTKDFDQSLEAMMMDPAATYGQRFMAWLKRRSWGNYRLYAAKDGGKPAIQADCSSELGIDKRKISEIVNFYEKRGYLYREGKVLYPSISPKLPPIPEKVPDSQDFLDFQESWKVTHSSDFLAWEAAREAKKVTDSTVKRLEKVRLSAYKEWQTARTNGAVSLLERRESTERESVCPSKEEGTPEPEPTDRPPLIDQEVQTTKPPEQKQPEPNPTADLEKLLQPLCHKLKDTPTRFLLQDTLKILGETPLPYLVARIEARWDKITRLGMVMLLAGDAARVWATEQVERAIVASQAGRRAIDLDAERRRDAEATLRDPDASEQEKEIARIALGIEVFR